MNARPANEPDPRGRPGLLPGPYDARSARDPQRSTRSRLMPVRRELHPIRPAQPHPQPLVEAPAQARSRTLPASRLKIPKASPKTGSQQPRAAHSETSRSQPCPTEPRRPQSQRAADPYPIWHPARVPGPPPAATAEPRPRDSPTSCRILPIRLNWLPSRYRSRTVCARPCLPTPWPSVRPPLLHLCASAALSSHGRRLFAKQPLEQTSTSEPEAIPQGRFSASEPGPATSGGRRFTRPNPTNQEVARKRFHPTIGFSCEPLCRNHKAFIAWP
jgi:hypothetical protein